MTEILHIIFVVGDISSTLVNHFERIPPYSEMASIMTPISEASKFGTRDNMRPEIVDTVRAATCHLQLGQLNTPSRGMISCPVSLSKT
jgi:hypothetical protein